MQLLGSYNMGPLDPLVLFVGRLATQKGPGSLTHAHTHTHARAHTHAYAMCV